MPKSLEWNESRRIHCGFETRSVFFDGEKYFATTRRFVVGAETVVLFEAETKTFKGALRFLQMNYRKLTKTEINIFFTDYICARCSQIIPYEEKGIYLSIGACGNCAHTLTQLD